MIHLNLDMPHLQIPKLQSALSCGLLRLVVAHLCKEQKKGQFCFGVWFSLAYSWASIFGSFKSPESKNGSSKICNDIVYNPQPHTWSETVFPLHVLWNRSGNPPCHLLLPFFLVLGELFITSSPQYHRPRVTLSQVICAARRDAVHMFSLPSNKVKHPSCELVYKPININ